MNFNVDNGSVFSTLPPLELRGVNRPPQKQPPQTTLPYGVGPPPQQFAHSYAQPTHNNTHHPLPPNFEQLQGTQQPLQPLPEYRPSEYQNSQPRPSSRQRQPQPTESPPSPNEQGGLNNLETKLSSTNRIGFVRKVYGILSVQLLFTVLLTAITMASAGVQLFMRKNTYLIAVAAVVSLVTCYALACFRRVARSVPCNYVLLALFTLAQAYVVAFVSAQYSPAIVLGAATVTAAMVVGLTAYACYTKTDFTMLGGLLFAGVFILIALVFVGAFIHSKIYHTVVTGFSVLLFSVFLVYDTQLIIGKHAYKYSVDDYIVAAMNLYIDIVRIFLDVLRLIGSK